MSAYPNVDSGYVAKSKRSVLVQNSVDDAVISAMETLSLDYIRQNGNMTRVNLAEYIGVNAMFEKMWTKLIKEKKIGYDKNTDMVVMI